MNTISVLLFVTACIYYAYAGEETGSHKALCTAADIHGIRSHASLRSSRLTIKNRSNSVVNINWIDFSGREKRYWSSVCPGRTIQQGSYVSHVWVARDVCTNQLMHLEGGATPCSFSISSSPDGFDIRD